MPALTRVVLCSALCGLGAGSCRATPDAPAGTQQAAPAVVPALAASDPQPLTPRAGGPLALGDPLDPALVPIGVSDLLARGEQLQGQVVRVEGKVTAFCHHRRTWFAVREPAEEAGAFVRVLTSPRFLVPQDCMGRLVRAEGAVELSEVSAETAKHFAQGHNLGTEQDVRGPARSVIVRASGAEFL